MATHKQRGVFVDQITKLGLQESIRQGYLDPVIDGMKEQEGGGETSAELMFRVEQVEEMSKSNRSSLVAQKGQLDQTDGRVTDLADVIARQESALNLQKSEVLRLTDLTNESIRAHGVYDQEIKDRKASEDIINQRLSALQLADQLLASKDVDQDRRIGDLEGMVTGNTPGGLKELTAKVATKADLVGGKIPMSQLPELPTGRKVTVANEADRLILEVHNDITIAYQTSDALAYILAANADPSNPSNWQRIGNTAATGVVSFKGRAGVVEPATGDYTAEQITESANKRFVSDADKNFWNGKIGRTEFTAESAAVRAEAESKYVPKNTTDFVKVADKGVAGGVVPLGADSKISSNYLPPLGMTAAQVQRLDNVESSANLANQKGDSAATNILTLDNKISMINNELYPRVSTLESNRTADRQLINAATDKNAAQDVRLDALEAKASEAGIPVSEKGVASGVAPLDADGKVPLANLPITPVKIRSYWDVKATRTVSTFYPNAEDTETTVFITAAASASPTRQLVVQIRKTATPTTVLTLKGDMVSAGFDHTSSIQFAVPKGWEYALTNQGGTNAAGVDTWYELR